MQQHSTCSFKKVLLTIILSKLGFKWGLMTRFDQRQSLGILERRVPFPARNSTLACILAIGKRKGIQRNMEAPGWRRGLSTCIFR